ncbi:hypothetical protein EDD11_010043 [Mortierella claussenii]|nr:hypothetical protein EDD11_010043 [Mortierella claussenii]
MNDEVGSQNDEVLTTPCCQKAMFNSSVQKCEAGAEIYIDPKYTDLQVDVNPVDTPLHPSNFDDMISGLHKVGMKELKGWFNIGVSIHKVVAVNSNVTGHGRQGQEQLHG